MGEQQAWSLHTQHRQAHRLATTDHDPCHVQAGSNEARKRSRSLRMESTDTLQALAHHTHPQRRQVLAVLHRGRPQ